MIAFLSGTIYKKELNGLLIDVQGIGYRVLCPISVIDSVQENAKVFLYTHHHIREDDMTLFGFLKKTDLSFFQKLISVSGIGPKTALDIMEISSDVVHAAIEQGDVDFLKSLKGIGKKTAERIIVELRGNLPEINSKGANSLPSEVVDALLELGFEKSSIHTIFRDMSPPFPSSEEMIKWFLKKVGS